MSDRAVVFECQGDWLVGVISVPAVATDIAVLILVGGPQYRVGSHRHFVQLARYLAEHGVASMRFDVRGMGDSSGAQRAFEEMGDDIGAAIDALASEVPTLRRFVLWGLCGGASAALLYWRATRDPRVKAMALVNPWVSTQLTQARTRVKHYYIRRVMQREFWVKLLRGRVGTVAVSGLLSNLRAASRSPTHPPTPGDMGDSVLREHMADGWSEFDGPKLLVLSDNDYTAKEFLEAARTDLRWRRNLALPSVTRLDLVDADHTFSQMHAQRQVEAATIGWLSRWQ